jgi:outer membrane protein assembly factor BamD
MRFAPARLPSVLGILTLLIGLLTSARADLVWSPQTGWRVEGGALSGLAGAEGRNALDQMNRARTAEENGNSRTAIRNYAAIARKWPNSVYAPEALYRSARIRLTL